MNILDFKHMKQRGSKITMVTSYDFWSARIIEESQIDAVMVGDSAAMVVHGFPSTIHATLQMMVVHTQAVARALKSKFLIADMPFLSYHKGWKDAFEGADQLMKAGAHAIKLEGIIGHEETVERLVLSGVPVMGHIGMTPQSEHQFGGYRVQGRKEHDKAQLMKQAKLLEQLGAFALVLECIPHECAHVITQELSIPTIGIGAGASTDGQILVLQDLLGMNPGFRPRFLRCFMNGATQMREALDQYCHQVHEGSFPSIQESYE